MRLRVEARKLDLTYGLPFLRFNLSLCHPAQFLFSTFEHVVITAVAPLELNARREAIGDSEFAAPRLDLLLCFARDFRRPLGRLFPGFILVKRVFLA